MLIRISLILAIIAALGAGALNFFVVKDKLTALVEDRDTQKKDKETAQNDLASTRKKLASTQGELSQTKQQLTDAQAAQKSAEDVADKATKHASDLTEQLAKTTQEREEAKNNLAAYQATGVPADQIGKLSRDNKDLKDAVEAANQENGILKHARDRLQARLDKYEGNSPDVLLPAGLKGKVVQVDPKWDFVVLNIGEDQGVLPDGELLVSRDGKLVAKVIVRSIEKDRCTANVVPGWKLGEPFEGDMVSPAHPAS